MHQTQAGHTRHDGAAAPQPDAAEAERLSHKLASDRELVEYLEGLSGKVFYTRQDLTDYVGTLREGGESNRKYRLLSKQTGWLVFLVVAFLQYVFVDLMIEVNSLRTTSAVIPAARTTGYRM